MQTSKLFEDKAELYASSRPMYPKELFDLVNVAQALHWFDFSKFWNEVQRVLKFQGVFVAYSYLWPSVDRNIDGILDGKKPVNHHCWFCLVITI